MKHTYKNKSCLVLGAGAAVLASTLLWSTPLIASDYSFSGESNTIFRTRKTSDDKKIYPAYEYIRLNMTNESSDGSAVSVYIGAWGRADLGDSQDNKSTDGDLQYAYLTYHGPKNNTAFSIGRQFISEGIATELFDGIYLLTGEDGSVANASGFSIMQYVWGKFWVNNHAHILQGKAGLATEHVMLALQGINITPYITGAVQAKLSQTNMWRINILKPSLQLSEYFGSILEPLFVRFRHNAEQAKTLSTLRDTLLPRLISGQLRLPQAGSATREALA